MKKWTEPLTKLISEMEEHRDALQLEQDTSEEEMENFDPEEEGAIEPEQIEHQGDIDQLDEVLDLLNQAMDLIS